jgi:hypothetical protein
LPKLIRRFSLCRSTPDFDDWFVGHEAGSAQVWIDEHVIRKELEVLVDGEEYVPLIWDE